MEVVEREDSQSRRSSIKRPWEEDTGLPERGNGWHSALLPPIDDVPYRRGSLQRGGDDGRKWNRPDPKESVLKWPRFEGHDYNTFPRQNPAPNGKTAPSRNSSKLDNKSTIIHSSILNRSKSFNTFGFSSSAE